MTPGLLCTVAQKGELLNVRGIYHKIVFGANYKYTRSNEPYTRFPQLDRLNEDATDQAIRDITPRQPFLNPALQETEDQSLSIMQDKLAAGVIREAAKAAA